jgi:ketosteroid isomerase-like protein
MDLKVPADPGGAILTAMSEDSIATVRRIIEAVNARDVDGYLELCHDDVELVSPLTPLEGSNVGPDGVRRFFAAIAENAREFHLAMDDFEEIAGERVLAVGRLSATSQGGIPLDRPMANLYELDGGKLRRVTAFTDRDDALRAAAGR